MPKKKRKLKMVLLEPGDIVRIEWRDACTEAYPERCEGKAWLMRAFSASFFHSSDDESIRVVQTWFRDGDDTEAHDSIAIPLSQVKSITKMKRGKEAKVR